MYIYIYIYIYMHVLRCIVHIITLLLEEALTYF